MTSIDCPEHHPLFNGEEFREELIALGFHKALAGALFNRICGEYLGKNNAYWDAESVAYRVDCYDTGRTENVISMPNLVRRQREILALPQIHPRKAAALHTLIEHYVQPPLPFDLPKAM